MKKESKIILVSGMAITFKENDKVKVNEEEIEIKNIPNTVMNLEGDIIINHNIETGEYMEYYLTREKITWSYYSETKDEDND